MQALFKILCFSCFVVCAFSTSAKPQPLPPLPRICDKSCTVPFGKELGLAHQVIGYSNCNNDCESDEWNYTKWQDKPIKTGMKWQCVEYARRWYISQLGHSFESIEHAYQIWDLDSGIQLGTEKKVKWLKFTNGSSLNGPSENDLLIYNTQQGVHGHVAVIVYVAKDSIRIAEQNYSNFWRDKAYSRTVTLTKTPKGKFKVEDKGIIGWMRLDRAAN